MSYLIYDIEIKKAILGRNEHPQQGVEYCEGWNDHANMGVSCIGAYDSLEDRCRLFMDDNLGEFFALAARRSLLVTFNGLAFDNKVITAYVNGGKLSINEVPHYDLLVETWAAAGLGPTFQYPSHAGYGLDAICASNFNANKSGNGALAPVDFQKGRFGTLIDYCLNDVRLTKCLFDHVIEGNTVKSPKDGSELRLRHPSLA